MEHLPNEILDAILLHALHACRANKEHIVPMRLVCKAFDRSLRPYFFKCLQLGFNSFGRDAQGMDIDALERVGDLSDSLYLDMMIMRDEEEIQRLGGILNCLKPDVPEFTAIIEEMKGYCMGEYTFDENDFRGLLELVIKKTPNMTRLKLDMPFQVVTKSSRTATFLLATTNSILAQRSQEFKPIEYLSIEHVSDTCFIDICNNPIDVINMITVFRSLKHLTLSIKRNEYRPNLQTLFIMNFWYIITQAKVLETLCIAGWGVRKKAENRVNFQGAQPQLYHMWSLPFSSQGLSDKLSVLRCLELRRVNMDATALVSLISQVAKTLREVFLFEVYLSGRSSASMGNTSLWIGYPGFPKPPGVCWVADELHNVKNLNLTIIRVTSLGYIDFGVSQGTDALDCYDLQDPTGHQRSFDERFVQAVMAGPDPIILQTMDNLSEGSTTLPSILSPVPSTPSDLGPTAESMSISDANHSVPPGVNEQADHKEYTKLIAYDADTYQKTHNSTSWYRYNIDGYFDNHHRTAIEALRNIVTVVERGMAKLQTEIDRATTEGSDLTDSTFWRAPTAPPPHPGSSPSSAPLTVSTSAPSATTIPSLVVPSTHPNLASHPTLTHANTLSDSEPRS